MTHEEIIHDFRKRYEGTYVFVQEPNSTEENLFYVESISADKGKVGALHLTSPVLGTLRLNLGGAHTLKFIQAPVGVFQHGADAYCCQRKPLRQWRRGLCTDNMDIVRATHRIYIKSVSFTHELISSAFTRQTYSLKDAFPLLATLKYRSVALQKNFSVSQPFTTAPSYVLFFWEVPIATISDKGTLITILDSVYEPNITQFLFEEGQQ